MSNIGIGYTSIKILKLHSYEIVPYAYSGLVMMIIDIKGKFTILVSYVLTNCDMIFLRFKKGL